MKHLQTVVLNTSHRKLFSCGSLYPFLPAELQTRTSFLQGQELSHEHTYAVIRVSVHMHKCNMLSLGRAAHAQACCGTNYITNSKTKVVTGASCHSKFKNSRRVRCFITFCDIIPSVYFGMYRSTLSITTYCGHPFDSSMTATCFLGNCEVCILFKVTCLVSSRLSHSCPQSRHPQLSTVKAPILTTCCLVSCLAKSHMCV